MNEDEQPTVQEQEQPGIEDPSIPRQVKPPIDRQQRPEGPVERIFDRLDIHPELKNALAEFLPYHFMYAAQAEAVARALDGNNVVAAIPTGAGKSVIGYVSMLNNVINSQDVVEDQYEGLRLETARKGLYIVPFKALAEEKAQDLKRMCSRMGLKVEIMTGDRRESGSVPRGTDVVLATAEKVYSMITHRDPWLMHVGTVVADEVHTVMDSTRGPTYESVLTQLQAYMPNVQITALSGTVPNVNEIANWLQAVPVSGNVRPSRLRSGVYDPYRGGIEYDDGTFGKVQEKYRDRRSMLRAVVKDALKMDEQVLVFAASKKSTEELANMLRSIYGVDKVAFHHAGLNREERRKVEEAYKNGTCRVLVATTTLAAGVNLPADTAVIYDTQRFNPDTQAYEDISVSEIKQMEGRAGRKPDSDGRAIVFPLIDEGELSRFDGGREPVTPDDIRRKVIYADPEPVVSALGDRDRMRMQVLSMIAAGCASREDLTDLIGQTLWGRAHLGDRGSAVSMTEDILGSLVQDGFVIDDPFSGLNCSELGAVTARTGILPNTAKNFLSLCKNQRAMAEMSPEARDLYMMCALAQAKELSGINTRPELETYWKDELARWPTLKDKLPEDLKGIPDSRFRLAIMLTKLLNTPRKVSGVSQWGQWKSRLGVSEGQLNDLAEEAEWLTHAFRTIAVATGYDSAVITSLEPRLINHDAWVKGDIPAILQKMYLWEADSKGPEPLPGQITDEDEDRPVNEKMAEIYDVLKASQRIWALLNEPDEGISEEQFAEKYGQFFNENEYVPQMAEYRISAEYNDPQPVVRVPQPAEPSVNGWDRMSEAYVLRSADAPISAEKYAALLPDDVSASAEATAERIITGAADLDDTEKVYAEWYAAQADKDAAAEVLRDSVRRLFRIPQLDEWAKVSADDIFRNGIEPQIVMETVDQDLGREMAETEALEKKNTEYYDHTSRNIRNRRKAMDMTAAELGYVPLQMKAVPTEKQQIFALDGDFAENCAKILLNKVSIEGNTVDGEDLDILSTQMTGTTQSYPKRVLEKKADLMSGKAVWRSLRNGGAVVTVLDSTTPAAIAECIRTISANHRGAILVDDPDTAEKLAPYVSEDIVIRGGIGYPPWIPPSGASPMFTSAVSPQWSNDLLLPQDLGRLLGVDPAIHGINQVSYRVAGNKDRFKDAPCALLGIRNLPPDDPRFKEALDLFQTYPGTLVCPFPRTTDFELIDAIMQRAGRVILVSPKPVFSEKGRELVDAVSAAGGFVVASNIMYAMESADMEKMVASLATAIKIVSCDNPYTDPTALAVNSAKPWCQDISAVPSNNKRVNKALGIAATEHIPYIPGSNPAAELTLTLEMLGVRPRKIAGLAEACRNDVAMATAQTMRRFGDQYESAHQAALKRLDSMADRGIGMITVFDKDFDPAWVSDNPYARAHFCVVGNLGLIRGSARYSADGPEKLYDTMDDLDSLQAGDPRYSRVVGSLMQLMTSGAYDGTISTASHTDGARAADEAAYRTGSRVMRYIDIPIEDLMDLGGPDSELMWYLRSKKFADPTAEDRMEKEGKTIEDLSKNEKDRMYWVSLMDDDGNLDLSTIYGVERKVGHRTETDGSITERYEYVPGIGMRAFNRFCYKLDKQREDILTEARQLHKFPPTQMTVEDKSLPDGKITLPLHPTYSYRDILMDSIALHNATENGTALIVAPTGYRTKTLPDGHIWTPSQSLLYTMTNAQRSMICTGGTNRYHPEESANNLYLIQSSSESARPGSADSVDLYTDVKPKVFTERTVTPTKKEEGESGARGRMEMDSWFDFAADSGYVKPEPVSPEPEQIEPAPEPKPETTASEAGEKLE